jgi:hypothetical protein
LSNLQGEEERVREGERRRRKIYSKQQPLPVLLRLQEEDLFKAIYHLSNSSSSSSSPS